MALRPDDRGRGAGSSARERSRSRSNVHFAEAPDPTAYRTGSYSQAPASSVMPGSFDEVSPTYEVRAPPQSDRYSQHPPPPRTNSYGTRQDSTGSRYVPPPPPVGVPYPPEDGRYRDERYNGYSSHDQHRPSIPTSEEYHRPPPGPPPRQGSVHTYEEDVYRSRDSRETRDSRYERDSRDPLRERDPRDYRDRDSRDLRERDPRDPRERDPRDPVHERDPREREPPRRQSSYGSSTYKYTPTAAPGESRDPAYSYQYAQPPETLKYSAAPRHSIPEEPVSSLHHQFPEQVPRDYTHNAYDRDAHVVEVRPGDHEKSDRRTSVSTAHRQSSYSQQSSLGIGRPGGGLEPHMGRLSIGGAGALALAPGGGGGGGGGLPPPSPLLEAYHGTYQSISPLPLAIRPDDDDELDELLPLSPSHTRPGHKGHGTSTEIEVREKDKKRVKVYDGEEDAKTIATALNRHKVDADAICETLPRLSHDQVWELRKEYKKQVKIQGKGVNLPKHIKTKLTGNFGKVVYVTALGRWESEGYWANFFYQSHGSRRELLIESLMGRTNSEIRMIKDEFKDKRYSDSLTKCMEKELKMDKFRTAVLMALEERRQEEQDTYPTEYIDRDVEMLYRAVRAEKGGESTMLEIIVRRSDAHLKEVLKFYERAHGENFARASLKKSNNLVGEVIAHILNGVINKPARDALLLHHAIKDVAEKNKDDELRYELLISRLVRMHWDRLHMVRVKKEYYEKYKTTLEDAIEDATSGDFKEFLCELCET